MNSDKTANLLLKGGDGRTQSAMQSRLLWDYANINTNLKSLHALTLIPLSKELYDPSPNPFLVSPSLGLVPGQRRDSLYLITMSRLTIPRV